MIVPCNSLLLLVGLLVIPFTALGTFFPEIVIISSLIIALIFIITVTDAFLTRNSFNSISISAPQVARLSKDREGTVDISVKNTSQKEVLCRFGIAFPREISTKDESLTVLVQGESATLVSFPCTPYKRGNYIINKCYSETQSPFGLWSVRKIYDIELEIRVYPNLMHEKNNMAALFLNRGLFGVHTQRQVGRGREFEKLREYLPGDIYEDIYWKATAKRGRPITKLYQIERTQEVYIIMDCSRLSTRSPDPRTTATSLSGSTMLERFITSSLILALSAQRQGDLFGLLTFSNKIITFLRAQQGQAHYKACLNSLYTLEPQNVTPDFDELVSFITLKLRRRALLVFLTNLDDPILAESFIKNINIISKKHLILIATIKPPGAVPLFSDREVSTNNDIYLRLGGHIQWSHLHEIGQLLKMKGVRFSLIDNEKMSIQLVTEYMNIKKRQLI